MRLYSSGCAWKKEQRLDSWILNSLQVHIQQDIIVLWPLKVYQLEIFWENEFLIYDVNNMTHQSVWEYFIIHGVCTCLFLSSPRQESKHIISLNFRERRLKWEFCVSSAASWTLHGWVVMAALHFLKRHRVCASHGFFREHASRSAAAGAGCTLSHCFSLGSFWKGQGLCAHTAHP